MKLKNTFWILSFAVLGFAALALSEEKNQTAPSKSPPASKKQAVKSASRTNSVEYPIIGYIEKRDRTITIKAGPKGSLYTVRNRDGKTLCEDVSLEQLSAQAPEVQTFIKTAVAGVDAKVRVKSDARFSEIR